MTLPQLPRRRSLRWRFAAAFVGLLAVVVGVFSWAAYRAAHQGAIAAASARLDVVTQSVATLLARNMTSFLDRSRPLAADPRLRAPLDSPTPASVRAAETLLDSLSGASEEIRALTLHTAEGTLVARAEGTAPGDLSIRALPAPPQRGTLEPWVSGFTSHGAVVGFEVVIPVTRQGEGLGTLVYHLAMNASPESVAQVTDLIGEGASLVVGVPGGVWTNLVREVGAPPEAVALPGPATPYLTLEGRAVLGAGARIDRTPWVVRIEVPQDAIVAAPRALLGRLIPVGALVLMGGALAGLGLSHRITRNLHRLSDAAGGMAAGDYQRRVTPEGEDEVADLARAFNAMAERVKSAHERLEGDVSERTAELRAANQELEAFSYSVSHDLRTPLRAVHGFTRSVLDAPDGTLSPSARGDLERVCAAAERMGVLIDDLLALAQATRAQLRRETLDLETMAAAIVSELRSQAPRRQVDVHIEAGLTAPGDRVLVRQVLQNLLENAWKFTERRQGALIEFSRSGEAGTFVVRDNGAGFDSAYAHKLFEPFERLHPEDEYAGSGVGLALVSRVIRRHGGRLWAEGTPGQGAAFFFTLPGGAA